MKKKEQKIVRFYSDNPEHQKAFDILQKVNAEKTFFHTGFQNFSNKPSWRYGTK